LANWLPDCWAAKTKVRKIVDTTLKESKERKTGQIISVLMGSGLEISEILYDKM
jgi:hypothetical protein